jgi:uncharacterized membrane protein
MELNLMTYLIAGVLIWSLLHFMPAVPIKLRANFISKTSGNVYKALAGILIIVSIVLMVVGWKAMPRDLTFTPFSWGDQACFVLMLLASVMFFAPYVRNSISNLVRHPQLVGLVFWGVGHILATGQMRSLVLFGGLSVWAIIEIMLLNRRDGAWKKPGPVSMKANIKLLVTGAGFFLIFVFTHLSLFGVPALPN